MIPLALAAAVASGGSPERSTLAGVTLGSNIAHVLKNRPAAERSTDGLGRWWRWARRGGGAVTVTADDAGRVTRVDFMAEKGQRGTVDLPCIGAFRVRDTDAALNLALGRTPCSAFNGEAYGLPDRSIVEVRFEGASDGQLIEATWYRPSRNNPSPVGHGNSVIDYLRPELGHFGGVARLYYAGECLTTEPSDPLPRLLFPSVWLMPSLRGATGLVAVQQIFRDDPHVAIAQDRTGILRVTIGSVSDALLQMRMTSLELDSVSQYDVESALDSIAYTVNRYAKQRELPFGLLPHVIERLVGGPVEGAPHLPELMQNVTVDRALDDVARTFKGIVTYGECRRPDGKTLFLLGFASSS